MTDLLISHLKPNPTGKDRTMGSIPNSQLVGEWVDIKNTSGKKLNMAGVKVYDNTFGTFCSNQGERLIFTFGQFSLPAGEVVRIHSGDKVSISSLAFIDRSGADYHAFTGDHSYAWNNVCGDIARVRNSKGVLIDRTHYNPRPVEGRVLNRVGQVLI